MRLFQLHLVLLFPSMYSRRSALLLRRMRRQACTGGRKDLITLSKVDCGTLSYKELHGVTTLQDLELPEPLLPYSIISTLHCDRIVVLTEVPDRGMYIIATSFFFSSWL